MQVQDFLKTRLRILRLYFWMLLILWTVFVGSVLLWNIYRQKIETAEAARIVARSALQKDMSYRRWATSHGGVYVPITEKTPPNPYLSYLKERDITTPSGRALTLVNPAYMARQHNDANVLALGALVLGKRLALAITQIFLQEPFSQDERHIKRLNKIHKFENVSSCNKKS